jgi:hypothetical protein
MVAMVEIPEKLQNVVFVQPIRLIQLLQHFQLSNACLSPRKVMIMSINHSFHFHNVFIYIMSLFRMILIATFEFERWVSVARTTLPKTPAPV